MSERDGFDEVRSADEALDSLLGAYALDAVDEADRRTVDEYLMRTPRARAEVRDHREVASMLAWSGSSAPDGLWDRIASSIDEQAPAPSGELAEVLAMRHFGRRRRARARIIRTVGTWVGVAAAAAAVAVVAVHVAEDATGPQEALEAQVGDAFRDPDSSVVTLSSASGGPIVRAVIEASGRGYLVGQSLPPLGDGRTYQLWGRVDGELVSLGLLGSVPAIESFRVGDDVSELVVTAERDGGVVESSNAPVVVGDVD